MDKKAPSKITRLTFFLVNTLPLVRWNQLGEECPQKHEMPIVMAAEDVIGCHFTGECCSQQQGKVGKVFPRCRKRKTAWTWTVPVVFGQVWLYENSGNCMYFFYTDWWKLSYQDWKVIFKFICPSLRDMLDLLHSISLLKLQFSAMTGICLSAHGLVFLHFERTRPVCSPPKAHSHCPLVPRTRKDQVGHKTFFPPHLDMRISHQNHYYDCRVLIAEILVKR